MGFENIFRHVLRRKTKEINVLFFESPRGTSLQNGNSPRDESTDAKALLPIAYPCPRIISSETPR